MSPYKEAEANTHISVLYVEDQIDTQEEFADILSLYVDG